MSRFTPGTYAGQAQGFAGKIKVNVQVDEAHIQSLDVEIQSETPEVGGQAIPLLAQAMKQANSAEVDIVSGATHTSHAMQRAVSSALNAAQGLPTVTDEVTYEPGSYIGEAEGFSTRIRVNVTVDQEKITYIDVIQQKETAEVGGQAIPILVRRILEANSTDIDGVSGASLSSNGLRQAVQNALDVASGKRPPLSKYRPGQYQAHSDALEVRMTFSTLQIEDLEYNILNPELEDFRPALDQMKNQILDLQRFEFDSISGASLASQSMRQTTMQIYDEAAAESYDDRLAESPLKNEMRVEFANGSLTLDQIDGILNAITEEIIFVGPDLRFQYFNEDAKTYTYSKSHLGELYTDCHPPQARAISRKLSYELATRQRKSYSFWYIDGNGDKLFITYQAIFNKQGEFIGLLGWTMNGQPILDTIDEPVRRGSFDDPMIPNPLLGETEKELQEFFASTIDKDPIRDYAVRELNKLDRSAGLSGEGPDTSSSATVKKETGPTQADTTSSASQIATDTSEPTVSVDTQSSASQSQEAPKPRKPMPNLSHLETDSHSSASQNNH